MSSTEPRMDLVAKHRLINTGAGYVLGRIDAGDCPLDVADAETFGEYFAERGRGWLDLRANYDEFVRTRPARDGAS